MSLLQILQKQIMKKKGFKFKFKTQNKGINKRAQMLKFKT
jgi:hypothetical protein